MGQRRVPIHKKQQPPRNSSPVPSPSNTSHKGPNGVYRFRAPTELKLKKLKRSRDQLDDEDVPSPSANLLPTNVYLRLEGLERQLERMETNLDAFFRFMQFDPPCPLSPSADPIPTNVDLRLERIKRLLNRMETNQDAFFRFTQFNPPCSPP